MAVGGEKEGKEKELLRIQWRSLSSPVGTGATGALVFTVGSPRGCCGGGGLVSVSVYCCWS